jgi:CBS domain-containing protein
MTEPQHQSAKSDNQTMYSMLSSIVRRSPITVTPDMSVHEALQIMDRHRIGSIVVTEADTGVPLGIFTLQDLLRRVALPSADPQQPIANVMTRDLVSLSPQATAYQAALLMARRNVRHLLVVDENRRLTGIVSQNDLFALQRVGVKEVSTEIGSALDLDTLVHSAREIRMLADNMLAQGVGAEQLTHFISTLNDLLTLRIIELAMAEFELPQVDWCWIALGSEGRFEQTFSTDQDNGIIFQCDTQDAEALRRQFLPFAQTVNRMLDACGFLLCKGQIMAGNPMWCLSLTEWRGKFGSWINAAEPQALLFASIFFDFRPLYGKEELSDSLREWLLAACAKQPLFLRHMADNALLCRPPLGVIRDFVFDKSREYPHTIDLKMYGAWPFVDSARIFALAHGIEHTSTAQRLRAALDKMHYKHGELAAIIDSFYYIQLLRLRHQHELRGQASGANRIDPDDLNELERQILKESFKQARSLQDRLKLDYQL